MVCHTFYLVYMQYIQSPTGCTYSNENSGWAQATTKQGEERYDVVFPKYKKGGYIVRKVTVDPTYYMQ